METILQTVAALSILVALAAITYWVFSKFLEILVYALVFFLLLVSVLVRFVLSSITVRKKIDLNIRSGPEK